MLIKLTFIDEVSSQRIDFKMSSDGFKHIIKTNPELFIKNIERYEELFKSNPSSYTEPEYTPFFPPGA